MFTFYHCKHLLCKRPPGTWKILATSLGLITVMLCIQQITVTPPTTRLSMIRNVTKVTNSMFYGHFDQLQLTTLTVGAILFSLCILQLLWYKAPFRLLWGIHDYPYPSAHKVEAYHDYYELD